MRTRIAQPGAVTWNQKGKIWARRLLCQPGGRYFYAPFCKWQRETALGIILSQLLIIWGGPFQATCYLCAVRMYIYIFNCLHLRTMSSIFVVHLLIPTQPFCAIGGAVVSWEIMEVLGRVPDMSGAATAFFVRFWKKSGNYIWVFFWDVYTGAPR